MRLRKKLLNFLRNSKHFLKYARRQVADPPLNFVESIKLQSPYFFFYLQITSSRPMTLEKFVKQLEFIHI